MLAEILVDIPLPEEPRLELGEVNAASLEEGLKNSNCSAWPARWKGFTRTFSAHPAEAPPAASSPPAANPPQRWHPAAGKPP